jgi:DNA replicative helicase MCM subunit Mcm2 (Cdc46/Mcm family)
MTSDYHNLRPADPRGLERWSEDNAQREEEFARERRREERAQRRAAEAVAATECARLRAEIEALRIEMEERDNAVVRGLAEGMIEHLNEIVDDADRLVKRTINELYDKVDQRLTILEERIAATPPKGRREFQFARERDASEITELPNPLPPRRAIN